MVLTEPFTLSILVVFKKTVFFRILSANFCQKKLLAMMNYKKRGLYRVEKH